LPQKQSSKSLPSVTLDKEVSVNCTSTCLLYRVLFVGHSTKTLSSVTVALGKENSPSRHYVMVTKTLSSVSRTLGKDSLFAELLLYRASAKKPPVAPLPVPLECIRRHSTKAPSLSSAGWTSSQQWEHQWVPLSVSLLTLQRINFLWLRENHRK
jgi:hypothetical protein